jgi:hypothetical protein
VTGSWGGIWGSPRRCGSGSWSTQPLPNPLGFWGAIQSIRSTVTITGQPGGVCNTVIPSLSSPPLPSGQIDMLFCHHPNDKQAYLVTLKVSCSLTCTAGGSVGASVFIKPGGGEDISAIVTGLSTATTVPITQQISVITNGSNYQSILSVVPTLSGQSTGSATVTCTVTVVSITPLAVFLPTLILGSPLFGGTK